MKARSAPLTAVFRQPKWSVNMLTTGEQKNIIPMARDPTQATEIIDTWGRITLDQWYFRHCLKNMKAMKQLHHNDSKHVWQAICGYPFFNRNYWARKKRWLLSPLCRITNVSESEHFRDHDFLGTLYFSLVLHMSPVLKNTSFIHIAKINSKNHTWGAYRPCFVASGVHVEGFFVMIPFLCVCYKCISPLFGSVEKWDVFLANSKTNK